MNKLLRFISIQFTFKNRRILFYKALAKAIIDADSLRRFLQANADHLNNYGEPRQADLYLEMIDNLNAGNGSLRLMMTGLVPESDLLILSSIDAGRNDQEKYDGLMFLAKTVTELNGLKKMIRKALELLVFVVPIMIAMLISISHKFVPLYERNLPHEKWPAIGQCLYWLSYATTHWYMYILPGVALVVYLFAKSFSTWTGNSRRLFERYATLLRIPYVLNRNYTCSTYFVSMAALLQTKANLKEALEKLLESSNKYLAWHIEATLDNLKRNPGNITEAFDTGLLPPDLHLALSNYSQKNGFEAGLIELGTTGIENLKMEVETASGRLNLLTIVFVALSIAFLYFGNLEIAYEIKNQKQASTAQFN